MQKKIPSIALNIPVFTTHSMQTHKIRIVLCLKMIDLRNRSNMNDKIGNPMLCTR